jgi:hypothetical protein
MKIISRTLLAIAALWALSIVPFAQAKKLPEISVQWTLLHPRGFEHVKSWADLPKKPDPDDQRAQLGPIDDLPGWISAIKIGTRIISSCDQYAVVQKHSYIESYCWRESHWYFNGIGCEVCRYDSTGTSCVYYGDYKPRFDRNSNFSLPLYQIKPPDMNLVFHGKYMPDQLWGQHRALWK